MKSPLSDQQKEWVKEQWQAGRSASEISRALSSLLGQLFTRNAVIGIIHRSGLARGPGTSVIRLPRPQAAKLPRPTPARLPRGEKVVPDPGLVVTMQDVEKAHCRWPVELPGDTRFLYCGRARFGATPFCEGHAAEGYQPRTPSTKGRKP